MTNYQQGIYTPVNPDKYHDPKNQAIVYRSSYELKFLQWCDANPIVEVYSSECVVIPYSMPGDPTIRRYFVDFKVTFINGKVFIIEIKPHMYLEPPKNNLSPRIMLDFHRNYAKWKAAKIWCTNKGYQFVILTEKNFSQFIKF